MRVELLWWPGCPSTEEALADLRAALSDAGLDPRDVKLREITTDEDAQRERFVGSPTIRLDGEDVVPPGDTEPSALTCRIYYLRGGRVSPTPDPLDLREAIAARIDRR
jgi:hypothetical protein